MRMEREKRREDKSMLDESEEEEVRVCVCLSCTSRFIHRSSIEQTLFWTLFLFLPSSMNASATRSGFERKRPTIRIILNNGRLARNAARRNI